MKNTGATNGVNYKEFIEESAEDLYENAPCGYISSLPDGTIIKINKTLLNWIGYPREEILEVKKFQDLLPIGGKIFYETHHAPLIQMQGFINELNYDIIRKNRTSFPALVNTIQIKDSQGKPLLNRTTIFNITDRKKYELELLHAKKKAEEATKVKADFLSTISHEIRTPLNAIIGVTNLLIEADPKPKQVEFLNILKFSSDHLLNLINDILDFSKIESGKVMLEEKSFNIKDLVYSILYSFGVKADEKGLQLKSQIDEKLPDYVIGDSVKISQVLTNLIGNAVKFTQEGLILVKLNVKDITENMISVDFSVTDTGIGIPYEKQEQIFEEFTQGSYTINQKYGGTGLGLTISRKLIELYGSKLTVESEPGKGATFYFNLKLKLSKELLASTLLSEDRTAKVASIKGVKLLLAEDNEVNIFVISEFLNKWEVNFDIAQNGAQAVENVTQNNYDIVLMDLQMPEMNGYDASIKIRSLSGEKYQKLPIIALSASSKIGLEERIDSAGINDFVGKPFDPKELYAKIATYAIHRNTHIPEMIYSKSRIQDIDEVRLVPASPSINLSKYIKLTKNNRDKLIQLIQISIEEFTNYKNAFKHVLQTRNKSELEQLAHKSKMIINLLEAKKIDTLVEQAVMLLEDNKTDIVVFNLIQAIEDEINKIILELQDALL